MPFTTDDFDRTIKKLRMTATDGKKHRIYWFEHKGRRLTWTMRSQGRGELGRVEFAVRKQLRVSGSQLRNLVDCPMSRDDYIRHLETLGLLGAAESNEESSGNS